MRSRQSHELDLFSWPTHPQRAETHGHHFESRSDPGSLAPDGKAISHHLPLSRSINKEAPSLPRVLQGTLTATIPSPHSLAAILSPSAPPDDQASGLSPSSTPKRTHSDAFSTDQHPYLHPASPTQHRVSIASSTEPSPGTRADDGGGGGVNGGSEEKKPQKMVRSSIACARCRRSKVKCVNTGVNSTCKACFQSSRECTYPPSGATSTPRRPETSGAKQEEGEGKKRVRKAEDSGRRNSARTEDPLESSILTRKVWDELYEIFKLHFSTEMPFLHPPTFRNRMRQASYPRDRDVSVPAADLQEGRLLLLGVLTLTARFHPGLVSYHSQSGKPVDPLDASEYYATALKTAFGPTGANLVRPSIDGIQALLMLGLYEWGQTRGLSAWVYVGIAIRLAQSMALAYEDDPLSLPTFSSKGKATPRQLTVREEATEKEVRRRTLWSCFVMDRMLSAGKFRPNMISVETLRVQLPCSDDQFLFVHDVKTGFLESAWSSGMSAQPGSINDDGVLSRYIRLVEIFGRFSQWSYAGGRRNERFPPWDDRTEFFQLRQELEQFHDSLPSHLAFTEANLSAHIEKRNATTYASLHTLYSLCLIMLHREYIPFIPLRCEMPQGPLDEPTFPKDKFQIPRGFWADSAERLYQAARDIVEIVRTCQDNNALSESPQIGFAVWQALFVCVYAVHFPKMDSEHILNYPANDGPANGGLSRGFDGVAVKILKEMIPRLKMVKGYVRSTKRMHDYFLNTVNDFNHRFHRKPLGWLGGGLEQYKTLEKELKEFGSLEDMDRNIPSDGSDVVDPSRSRASTNDPGQGSVNGEAMQGVEAAQTPRHGAWSAVNSVSPKFEPDDRVKYNQGPGYQYTPTTVYQQSPSQNSNPPSLNPSNASNGDSTPGINSPYTQGPGFQAQHIASYPSILQHSQSAMGPPQIGGQEWTDDQNQQWLYQTEQITMSHAGFDNLVQDELQYDYTNGRNFFGFLQGQCPPSTMSTY